ncbi:hypothetical protein HYS31_04570 [Candidatus Woesearchaeota archaeon]|nr:hypothetical protein [Candidatus Woesearchaeota archaeon]
MLSQESLKKIYESHHVWDKYKVPFEQFAHDFGAVRPQRDRIQNQVLETKLRLLLNRYENRTKNYHS